MCYMMPKAVALKIAYEKKHGLTHQPSGDDWCGGPENLWRQITREHQMRFGRDIRTDTGPSGIEMNRGI